MATSVRYEGHVSDTATMITQLGTAAAVDLIVIPQTNGQGVLILEVSA